VRWPGPDFWESWSLILGGLQIPHFQSSHFISSSANSWPSDHLHCVVSIHIYMKETALFICLWNEGTCPAREKMVVPEARDIIGILYHIAIQDQWIKLDISWSLSWCTISECLCLLWHSLSKFVSNFHGSDYMFICHHMFFNEKNNYFDILHFPIWLTDTTTYLDGGFLYRAKGLLRIMQHFNCFCLTRSMVP
jgi:hypothetical protein